MIKDLLNRYGKLALNAALAGFWVALATFVQTEELSIAAVLAAGAAGLRFAVGLVMKSVNALPTIPVDE